MNQVVTAIVSAVITGLFSLWGVYAANRKSQALIVYRLEQLERKVDKHNSVVERTYVLEGKVNELQHDVRDIKERS